MWIVDVSRVSSKTSMVRDGTHVHRSPMYIVAAAFDKVGQSVPYPGCINTITMTLAFNVLCSQSALLTSGSPALPTKAARGNQVCMPPTTITRFL